MNDRFERCLGTSQLPHVAESSVGLSEPLPTSLSKDRLRQLGFDVDATFYQNTRIQHQDPPVAKLWKERSSFLAAQIPADKGEAMDIVCLKTCDVDESFNCIDFSNGHVPDFSRFWGERRNFDRARGRYNARGETPESLDGDYFIHWNLNDTLSQSKTLKTMIGLDQVPLSRCFW